MSKTDPRCKCDDVLLGQHACWCPAHPRWTDTTTTGRKP